MDGGGEEGVASPLFITFSHNVVQQMHSLLCHGKTHSCWLVPEQYAYRGSVNSPFLKDTRLCHSIPPYLCPVGLYLHAQSVVFLVCLERLVQEKILPSSTIQLTGNAEQGCDHRSKASTVVHHLS